MKATKLAWWVVFIVGALYFLVPLLATFIFSLGQPIGNKAAPPSFEFYGEVLTSSGRASATRSSSASSRSS
jgi:ABC-type spermidine/putrescine transport system permease subunit II